MPAATTKADLLAIASREFAKLDALIADIPPAWANVKDADDTSIQDVIAHRAHWIELFLGWWADGQAGQAVHFPAPGYKWSELKRYNTDLRARQAGLSWGDAHALLQDRHTQLMGFLESQSDSALYGAPMKGARNAWTTGRWAEAAGPSHYRSAAKYVRARQREVLA